MTVRTLHRSPRQAFGALLTAIAVVLLATGTLTFFSAPAGAAGECGTYSYGFAGTRLLNDGISTSAGPFAIDLPAGTYTVTLMSSDHHDTQVNAETQAGESYHVVLNSGYVSPASIDIPDDSNLMTTTFAGQTIGHSTTISVKHAGAPGINSVNVVCVGFTPEATVEPVIETPVTDTPGGDDADDDAEIPVVRGPAVPPTNNNPPAAVIDPPTAAVDPPATAVDPPTAAVDPPTAAVDPPVEPEVKAKVELPVAQVDPPVITQLAITGPSTQAMTLLALGFLFIALGGLLVRGEKQFA